MKKYLRPIYPYILFDFIFSLITYVAMALMPYFTQELLKSHFNSAIIGYISCIIVYLGCNYLQMRVEWHQTIIFSTSLKNSWFNSILNSSQTKFNEVSVPEYISYQANDLDALEKDYLPPLTSFYKQIMRMLVFGIIISQTINIFVAIILLCSALLAIQIPKKTGQKTAQRREDYLNSQHRYYHKLNDLLSGQHLVNVKTSANFERKQKQALDELQHHYYRYGLMKSWGLVLNGISFEVTGIILFIYLAIALKNSSISLPEAAASLAYITAFSEPIQEILYDIQMLNSVKTVKTSFLALVSRLNAPKKPVQSFKRLELVDVSEKVGQLVLQVANLTVSHGDKIALIGDNGSGKTTFLNILIGRSTNFQGQIFLDGEQLVDLDNNFATILQKEHSFEDSYLENVTIFGSYPFSKTAACEKPQIATSMSGGEQQLMYLQRAINTNSPLLILDEPFSALDDDQFKAALERVLSLPSAVIMVLHQKKHVLEKFDHVWQLEQGTLRVMR